jgi:hypothetical protein
MKDEDARANSREQQEKEEIAQMESGIKKTMEKAGEDLGGLARGLQTLIEKGEEPWGADVASRVSFARNQMVEAVSGQNKIDFEHMSNALASFARSFEGGQQGREGHLSREMVNNMVVLGRTFRELKEDFTGMGGVLGNREGEEYDKMRSALGEAVLKMDKSLTYLSAKIRAVNNYLEGARY